MYLTLTDPDCPNYDNKTENELWKTKESEREEKLRELIINIEACILLFLGIWFNAQMHIHNTSYSLIDYFILAPAYFLAGWPVIWQSINDLIRGKILTARFLISLASIGAIAMHQLPVAVIIILCYAGKSVFKRWDILK